MSIYSEQISDFFISSKRKLKESSRQASIVGHRGSMGDVRESVLQDYLRPFIPSSYQMTKSILLDSKGNKSSEFDIVIGNSLWSSTIYESSGISPIFIENVIAIIEVRTFIDGESIKTFDTKISALSNLTRKFVFTDSFIMIQALNTMICSYIEKIHNVKGAQYIKEFDKISNSVEIKSLESGSDTCPVAPIRTVLFGYGGLQEDTLLAHLNNMSTKPDAVIVLDIGVYIKDAFNSYSNILIKDKHNDLELCYLSLFISDWIDKGSSDRLFVKSKLEFYL